MRLSPEQVAIIRQAAQESFGPEARVWLFGSRVDDSKRGGDIDLYVESPQPSADALDQQLRFWSLLQRRLGEQRIDIVIRAADSTPQAIHQVARRTGVPLS
ncbi:nucleotidyltransferase domain-containing protein [Acidithiobacillus montserratensis]|uniref:Nucleotidyltransferase domain-containing protein n=1 Tax=Acidithiobacillus montserratensis TaxID=2729135 RepID=A0ACD5HC67_9PROT|nr:nucleotidyltransferase domain-containing protein [Acidithiobacillus montserratensis]MBU2748098.1 nucleotidyltransferase domain-containing protein [Acidithiobacillus montserratensis]